VRQESVRARSDLERGSLIATCSGKNCVAWRHLLDLAGRAVNVTGEADGTAVRTRSRVVRLIGGGEAGGGAFAEGDRHRGRRTPRGRKREDARLAAFLKINIQQISGHVKLKTT
jgi:hypothetical protein